MSEDTRIDPILDVITQAAEKFRSPPSNRFLAHVVSLFRDEKWKVTETHYLMERLIATYDRFPSFSEMREEMAAYRKNEAQKRVQEPVAKEEKWVSRQAPGTPIHWEALFVLMYKTPELTEQQRRTRDIHLRLKLRRYTQEQVNDFFQQWKVHRVHPDISTDRFELDAELRELGIHSP